MLATAGALMISVCLNYILVPSYGASGALVSAVLAFAFFLVIKTELASRVWKPIARLHLYASALFFSGMAIVTIVFSDSLGAFMPFLWLVILFFTALIYWKNYKKIVVPLLSKFNPAS